MESTQLKKIEVGDHVTIGDGTIHWVVLKVQENPERWVYLESGMTGRRRVEEERNVKLFRKGN